MVTTDVLSPISSPPSYEHLPYSAASEPPTYSTQPSVDEETVAQTPLARTVGPRGSIVKKWSKLTLTLMDQDGYPTYGHYGTITGELGLKDTKSIVSVAGKFIARMSASTADSRLTAMNFCSETQVIWERDKSSPSQCPTIHPFLFEIPATYEANGKQWQMPPSFKATFSSLDRPAMLVKIAYELSIIVSRVALCGSWTTKKTYVTPVHYHPRSRPARPIISLGSVFESVKCAPEEWSQIISKIEVRPMSKHKSPIECQVLVPSIQTFAISDTIPFHVQLAGSLDSLQELLPSSSFLLIPSGCHFGASITNCGNSGPHSEPPAIRVFLARHVSAEINGIRKSRMFTIGEGSIWPVPPLPASGHQVQSNRDYTGVELSNMEICLDWQGEVRCWPEVTVGSFHASHLSVRDMLVISFTPPNPRSSFLVPLQVSHPIKLVTDAWVDVGALHPQDN